MKTDILSDTGLIYDVNGIPFGIKEIKQKGTMRDNKGKKVRTYFVYGNDGQEFNPYSDNPKACVSWSSEQLERYYHKGILLQTSEVADFVRFYYYSNELYKQHNISISNWEIAKHRIAHILEIMNVLTHDSNHAHYRYGFAISPSHNKKRFDDSFFINGKPINERINVWAESMRNAVVDIKKDIEEQLSFIEKELDARCDDYNSKLEVLKSMYNAKNFKETR